MSEEKVTPKSVKRAPAKVESADIDIAVESPDTPVAAESAPKSAYAVVGKSVQDPVLASVRAGSNKSLTVHHIQRRLAERGYGEVYRDRDGFWREGTTDALEAFTVAHDLSGRDHAEVLRVLFENDDNVEIVE